MNKLSEKQKHILDRLADKKKRANLEKIITTLECWGKPHSSDKLYPIAKEKPESYLDFCFLGDVPLTQWAEWLETTGKKGAKLVGS